MLKILCLLLLVNYSSAIRRGFGRCKEYEQLELEKTHVLCTQQVEQRYALTLDKFQVDIPPPVDAGRNNFTKSKKNQDNGEVCNLLHDAVEKCGQIYRQCLDDKEYRQFLDAQLELMVQLLTTLYNLGDEVKQCAAVQEYERSGRKDAAEATEICSKDEVKLLTIKYQQCMEDANLEMTRRMLSNQGNYEAAFQALCDGLDTVVHGCSVMLYDCYTIEEIEETKLGQLELMRKIFIDLVEENGSSKNQTNDVHWNFDITRCNVYDAYSSANKTFSHFFVVFNLIVILFMFLSSSS